MYAKDEHGDEFLGLIKHKTETVGEIWHKVKTGVAVLDQVVFNRTLFNRVKIHWGETLKVVQREIR